MKLIIGGCSGEIHTFLTSRSEFQPILGQEIDEAYRGTKTPIGGFIDVAEKEGIELIYTAYSSVGAAPLPTKKSYELIKSEILKRIDAAGEINGVLLDLHGALVIEDMPDGAEGDFTNTIREAIGPDIPIACTADAHANLSDLWVENVDAIFGYNSIPHIDTYERGVEAAEVLIKTVRREMNPIMFMKKPGMLVPSGLQLVNYAGERGPLPKVFARAFEWEKKNGIINVNVFSGWMKADVDNAGASIVVIADDNHDLAKKAAEDVARVFWNVREEFWLEIMHPREAVKMAMESEEFPVVIHDGEDDPGGGATCDGTEVLKTLIEMGAENTAVWLHDAEAVKKAIETGIGNTVTMIVGGKLNWREDEKHAQPLEITGKVKTISDGIFILKGPMRTGLKMDVGRTVVIDVNDNEVVLTEKRRAPTWDPELYRSVGIEPKDKKIIAVKQKHHWRAAYEPIVKKIISVHCPTDYSVSTYGPIDPVSGKLLWPYKKVRRPIWPLDRDTEVW